MGCDSCGAGRGEVVPVSGTGSDQSDQTCSLQLAADQQK